MALSKEQLENIKYINLVNHTHFSMPFGVGNVKAHIKRAMDCKNEGFAITDTNMGGVLEAYKICKEKKLPFVLGTQLNIIDDLQRQDKVNKYFTITCFAKNLTGYKNLVTLTSLASTMDHFYYKPRISLPELIQYSEGLVVLSGDINGMLSQSILRETGQEEVLMQIFKEHFGEDFYIEIHYHNLQNQWDKETKTYKDSGNDSQKIVNLKLIELARKYKVKCILVQNSFMPEEKHKILQDILIGNTPIGKDGWKFGNTYNSMTISEMYQKIQKESSYISDEQFLEWTQNSLLVLEKCKNLKLAFTPQLPDIKYEESIVNQETEWEDKFQELKKTLATQHEQLHDLFEVAEEDIALKTALKIMMRNAKIDFKNKIHQDRLNEELRVIQRNGIIKLCDYFLLLEDVTHFVRSNGFLRGFGRGSGAGSLVAYALDITDCDPIHFDLLFERFLTKERVGKLNFEIPGFPMGEYSKDKKE